MNNGPYGACERDIAVVILEKVGSGTGAGRFVDDGVYRLQCGAYRNRHHSRIEYAQVDVLVTEGTGKDGLAAIGFRLQALLLPHVAVETLLVKCPGDDDSYVFAWAAIGVCRDRNVLNIVFYMKPGLIHNLLIFRGCSVGTGVHIHEVH